MTTEENAAKYANILMNEFVREYKDITDYITALVKGKASPSMIEHTILSYANNYAEFMVRAFAKVTDKEGEVKEIYNILRHCEDVKSIGSSAVFNLDIRYIPSIVHDWKKFYRVMGLEEKLYQEPLVILITLEELRQYNII